MDWNLVLLMVGIHALMFLTSGPDGIVVISRATSQGIRHALAAILGIVSAGFVLVPAIAFAMDLVNSLSPAIWMAVRAAGAVYLIYMGYRMLRAAFALRGKHGPGADRASTPSQEPLLLPTFKDCSPLLETRRLSFCLHRFFPNSLRSRWAISAPRSWSSGFSRI